MHDAAYEQNMQRSKPITESKTIDITYPGAIAGVVTAETSMDTSHWSRW